MSHSDLALDESEDDLSFLDEADEEVPGLTTELQPGEFVGNEFALIELRERLTHLSDRAKYYREFPKTSCDFLELINELRELARELMP